MGKMGRAGLGSVDLHTPFIIIFGSQNVPMWVFHKLKRFARFSKKKYSELH